MTDKIDSKTLNPIIHLTIDFPEFVGGYPAYFLTLKEITLK